MKKLILSLALICFIGAAKTFAQSSATKASTPSTAAAVVTSPASTKATTVSGGQAVQTPATIKTTAKAETKATGCNHSSKSCCMSKDGAMKHCSHDAAGKAENKSENSDSKKN